MSHLPAALAPWSDSLAGLDPALAVDLGPMIHALDDLVGRLDSATGESGPPDGYDGMTNRGDPERLLAAEWLLADEVPMEFLRRAADGELLYLRRAHQQLRSHGRVLAVVDTGPDQLGAGRLVQLAALVVLDRRARVAGSELSVMQLQSGALDTGPLSYLLPRWLRARSPHAATGDNLARALANVRADDRAWLLCGPNTSGLMTRHRRKIVSRVSGWSPGGAAEVTLRVGDAAARLVLPPSPTAVAALRGEGLTRRPAQPVPVRVTATGRGAVFTSAEPQLLWRGAGDELYSVRVGTGESANVRRHRLPDTVLAASVLGRRIVAVLTDGERVWVHVIGKHLARVHEIEHPAADLDLTSAQVEEALDAPLRPVYFNGGKLLTPVAERWWEIGNHRVTPSMAVVVAPGPTLDSPRMVLDHGGKLYTTDATGGPLHAVRVHQGPVLGNEGHVAWSPGPRIWKVRRGGEDLEDIGIGEGEEVIGLTMVAGQPSLVTTTKSTRIVRVVSARGLTTLTDWAGPAHFDLHPTRPWIARTTPEGILVGDLQTRDTLLELGIEP